MSMRYPGPVNFQGRLATIGAMFQTFATEAFRSVQIFNSPTATGWSRPAGVTTIMVEIQGPGAGGGGCATTAAAQGAAAGGGGAGGYLRKFLDVSTINSADLVLATGGAGASAGNNNGSSATNSSWSDGTNTLIAIAGAPGIGAAAQSADTVGSGSGGAGGLPTGGDINIRGQLGHRGVVFISAGSNSVGGDGGNAHFGAGARGGVSANGVAATDYGGGGSGGSNPPSGAAKSGGDGGDSVIYVWEFGGAT